jgi:hypothetical protein
VIISLHESCSVENNRKGTIKNNINDDDTFDEREKVNKKTATSPNIP